MSKNKIYKGIIVHESLADTRILKNMQIIDSSKVGDWTLYTVLISKNQIDALPEFMKDGPWYAHFWHSSTITIVYKNETFIIHTNDDKERAVAVAYGEQIGIPKGQLTFPID